MKPIALQLYTLRDMAAQDFPGMLKAVADIGYKGVEMAGLYGHDPKEIAKLISDLGMVVCSSHAVLPTSENAQELADIESILGNKTIISGFGPDDFKTLDQCKEKAAAFQEAAQLLKPYGMRFGFHNHWWEFFKVDGKRVYDVLMAEAPDVFGELDVYWCAYGKDNPAAVVEQYSSRLPYLHVKDGMLVEGQHVHTAVGSGKLDIPAIIGSADPATLEWLVVELDACETDMLEAVKQSYLYLTSSGLALGNK